MSTPMVEATQGKNLMSNDPQMHLKSTVGNGNRGGHDRQQQQKRGKMEDATCKSGLGEPSRITRCCCCPYWL